MRCKASPLFLTQLKKRLLWAIFMHCVCFQCFMWCDIICHGCVYFYCDSMNASAINPVCSPAAGFGRARSESVCTADVGRFQNKRLQADHKRSDCPTAGREMVLLTCFSACVCLWQIQHVCLNLCVGVCVCGQKSAGVLGQIYLTIGTLGLSRCFQSAKSLSSIDVSLEMKIKKKSISVF